MTKAEEIWKPFLIDNHGIKSEVLQEHEIRYDVEFLYIPYFSKTGVHLFDKKRRLPTYTGSGKYLYGSGTSVQLWPNRDLLKSSVWILTEGELDTLTLESQDIPAITSGSSTSFKSYFAKQFKGKKVYICFDNDEAGKKGAEKVAQDFLEAKVDVHIIDLPFMEEGKDIGDFFKLGHTKGEFYGLIKTARKPELQQNENSSNETETPLELITTPLSYKEVEEKVVNYLPGSQIGLKLILATAISSIFPSEVLIWLLIVGVPSSGKTELVRLMRNAKMTYYLDNLTQNAFVSGERSIEGQKVYDLLPLLNKKCLIVKDWTSIFSHDEKMTKKLLGDLVNIYDKTFIKFSSRRGPIGYKSEFSQIGCITPAVLNKHTHYMNMVGPRFLCYSMPDMTVEDREKTYKAIFSDIDRRTIGNKVSLYVASYLQQLAQKSFQVKPLKKDVQMYLRTAAELMANCRGTIVLQASSFQNEEGKEIKYYDISEIQIEDPWRAIQQLKALAGYLTFVVGKNEVSADELSIIKDVVIASMPADRSQALRSVKEHEGIITAKELSEVSEKSHKTSLRLLDELAGLRVLEKIKGTGSIAADYKIRDTFKNFILLGPSEFLSSYSSETETPDGVEPKQESFYEQGGEADNG